MASKPARAPTSTASVDGWVKANTSAFRPSRFARRIEFSIIGSPPEKRPRIPRSGTLVRAQQKVACALPISLLQGPHGGGPEPPPAPERAPRTTLPWMVMATETPAALPSLSAADALAEAPFCKSLTAVDLARLVPELEEIELAPGQSVYSQGDPADGLYLIRSGT